MYRATFYVVPFKVMLASSGHSSQNGLTFKTLLAIETDERRNLGHWYTSNSFEVPLTYLWSRSLVSFGGMGGGVIRCICLKLAGGWKRDGWIIGQ